MDQWRVDVLAELQSGDVGRATDALLSLTYHESDRVWLEDLLLRIVEDDGYDLQVRQLATICLGHSARIHRAAGRRVTDRLNDLLGHPELASQATDALSDIAIFTRE